MSPERGPSSWAWRLAWVGILLLATGLRLRGIASGLDLEDPERAIFSTNVDAKAMVVDVRQGILRGNLDPHGFLHRGPLGFLLFGAVDALVITALSLENADGWSGVLRDLDQNPSLLHLLHRSVSALAGVLTVLCLVRIVRREFGEASALCAGLALSVAYLHVRESHFGTVDVLGALGVVAALDPMFRLARGPRPGLYIWSGFLIGLATAAKYFGIVLGFHLIVAHLFARARCREAGLPTPPLRWLLLGLGACPLAFLLTFPGLFAGAAQDFLAHYQVNQFQSLAPRWDSPLRMLLFHTRHTLATGLGEPVLLAALAGLWIGARRGPAGRLMVLSVLGCLPILVLTSVPVVRYGISPLVLLAAPAGLALSALVRRLPLALGPVALFLALLPSLARSLAFDWVVRQEDTRVEILAVLRERHLPPSEVLAIGFHHDLPEPATRPVPSVYTNFFGGLYRNELTFESVLADPPRLILWGPTRIAEEIGGQELEALVRDRYREVLRLEGCTEPGVTRKTAPEPRALMIPYARPWATPRPGPPIVLYERIES